MKKQTNLKIKIKNTTQMWVISKYRMKKNNRFQISPSTIKFIFILYENTL